MNTPYDVVVVGAGIVGAASAWQILRQWPQCRLLILEKEQAPARHQSGRNSGVVHAGVYYPPGSLKARMCREGLAQTLDFCRRYGLAHRQCGKWIVAATQAELPGLESLRDRARANGLDPQWLGEAQMRERQPMLSGVAALEVADSAIVDYAAICQQLLQQVQSAGGELRCGVEVRAIEEGSRGVTLDTTANSIECKQLLCCAGLMSDRLVRLQGLACDFRIIPFRGEFFRLAGRCENWFEHLVYPVPDPNLPFLGVHLTPRIDGAVLAGPNALLALAHEGYQRRDLDFSSLADMLGFPGFWRLLARHRRAGLGELANALSRQRYLGLLQRYCPAIEACDLLPAPAGVRAQAVNRRGEMLQDFHFVHTARSVHVGNAPSPAATSALPIGAYIAEQVLARR